MLTSCKATADSFARSGYFGGLRTVPWHDKVALFTRYGFNESGINLLLNLADMQTAKLKETEIDHVVRLV